MAEIRRYKHGTFCWTELASSDLEAAKVFYSELFNWKIDALPLGDAGDSCMMKLGDAEVAALRQRAPESPPSDHWRCYISVDDVDQAAAAVVDAGGALLQPPSDVLDAGRGALCQDPSGAVVGLWQAGRHIGAGRVNEPGAPCWFELATRDTAAAADFFRAVLGWEAKSAPMGGTVYTSFLRGVSPAAGMLAMDDTWGDIAPHWMVYFQVASCEETAQRAAALGGEVHVPPTEIAGVGRFAVIADPQGAIFSIMQVNPR